MLRDGILRALRKLLWRARARLYGWDEESPIERNRRHKATRWYFYNPAFDRSRRMTIFLSGAVLVAVFVFSAARLIGYAADYAGARRASDALRAAYYEDETERRFPTVVPTASETPAPTITVTEVPAATEVSMTTDLPVDESSAEPTATEAQRLPQVPYPGNPYKLVSSRFQKLRRQNADIIGWLTIDGMLDEAVVQRDNEYYLARDYRGYHNVNGAIFLDENCDLSTRPYTLMLYGHNMKTGMMFGSLRNYENPTYYHNNPFITFDTAYEDGRYVIFSVATISLDSSNWRFVNLSWLISSSAPLRSKAISALNRFSVYNSRIDVQPEDQLLLLITCVDEQTERRIITARRIRDGESEEDLLKLVKQSRLK